MQNRFLNALLSDLTANDIVHPGQRLTLVCDDAASAAENYFNIRTIALLATLLGSHKFFRGPGSEEVAGY